MVIIRMSRGGAKRRPFYRIVAIDSHRSRDSRPIERLGFFNPLAKDHEEKVRFNLERVDYWLGIGARISSRVASLLKKERRKISHHL